MRRFLSMAALLLSAITLTLLTPVDAHSSSGDTEAKQASGVQLTVTMIHATKTPAPADQELTELAPYLIKSFKGYRGFTKLSDASQTAARGAWATFKLPGSKTLKLKSLATENKNTMLTLQLLLGSLDTTVKVRNGGLFFQAGRVYKDGILVLAIQAVATY